MRELFVDLHRAQREQIPLESHESLLVEFSYKSDSGKVKMTYLASTPSRIQVEFSPDLARLLGYSPNFRYTQRHSKVSKFLPHMKGRIHSVYVYCDVLEHVPVGDTKASLLRIVDTDDKSIGNIHVQHHRYRHWYDRSLSIGKVVRRVGVSSHHSSVLLHIR